METARKVHSEELRLAFKVSISQLREELERSGELTPAVSRRLVSVAEAAADIDAFLSYVRGQVTLVETLDYAAGWDVWAPDRTSHNP